MRGDGAPSETSNGSEVTAQAGGGERVSGRKRRPSVRRRRTDPAAAEAPGLEARDARLRTREARCWPWRGRSCASGSLWARRTSNAASALGPPTAYETFSSGASAMLFRATRRVSGAAGVARMAGVVRAAATDYSASCGGITIMFGVTPYRDIRYSAARKGARVSKSTVSVAVVVAGIDALHSSTALSRPSLRTTREHWLGRRKDAFGGA